MPGANVRFQLESESLLPARTVFAKLVYRCPQNLHILFVIIITIVVIIITNVVINSKQELSLPGLYTYTGVVKIIIANAILFVITIAVIMINVVIIITRVAMLSSSQ